MSRLAECFGKEFLATSEITLPRGPGTSRFMEEIAEYRKLMGRLHAVNVVDNPGSMLLMGSLPASIMLRQSGVEPVYQATGRDRNRLGLQADLIGAAAFGIENVLALTGDAPNCESSDHPKAKGVFDLTSVSLIKAIKLLNEGRDYSGGKLNKPTNFFVGGALAPGSPALDGEIRKTVRKIEAGIDFFQTQVVFEPSVLELFLDRYAALAKGDIREKILVGVLPLYSTGLAGFLKKIPGIIISPGVEKRIKNAEDPLEEGVAISAEVIDAAKDLGFAGAHIMPAGRTEGLTRLLAHL
ncbi:MAG: methylenetetrahydrofolate reductase [Candidatus Altiarchaeota archaeon]|nr:methylenetetrahydrofolate reductase [Candidatus Altiarchaeota archaeon]